MIRTLRGTLLEKRPDAVVVEAGGVGYALAVPLTTSEVLPAPPAEVFLHTHFRVREDAHELFGFATAEARDLFERMLRIHRLPARSALSVLSHLSPEAFRAAVAAGDIATLTAIPGIGRKIAEKIVLELREAFATEPPPRRAGRGERGPRRARCPRLPPRRGAPRARCGPAGGGRDRRHRGAPSPCPHGARPEGWKEMNETGATALRFTPANDLAPPFGGTLVLLYDRPAPSRLPPPLAGAVASLPAPKDDDPLRFTERVLPDGGALLAGPPDLPAAPDLRGVVALRGAVTAYRRARALGLSRIVVGVPAVSLTEAIVRGFALARDEAEVGAEEAGGPPPEVVLAGTSQAVIERARLVAEGVLLARRLVERAPAEKPPEAFAEAVVEALSGTPVRAKVLRAKDLEKGGYGGVLAVGAGSHHPPAVLRLSYRPRGARGGVVLVGKGVTFDAGGLNLKSFEGMKTMKADCAGAAAVAGAFLAVARLGLPVAMEGLLGLVENLPGGAAFKPGDIVRTRSGRTVEVVNTDAEGRIVLADLLEDARRISEKNGFAGTVDLATLTGACMTALGADRAGLFGNDSLWANAVGSAAAEAGEWVWPLPLGPEHRAAVRSKVADVKNIGGKYGGASTAAAFLSFFAPPRWAHLDIAGPAYHEETSAGRVRGGTGFGVATLVALARALALTRGDESDRGGR